jgi:hypothetical protein
MSYSEYWEGDPNLAIAYKKAHEINLRRKNEELWLQGVYMSHALVSVMDGKKHPYPKEPLAITPQQIREKKEREAKAKFDRMKAMMSMAQKQLNRKGDTNGNNN